MTLPIWTTQQILNQLDSGSYWTGQSTITYDFPTVTTWLTGSTELSHFVAANPSQQGMATLAITLWGDLIPQTLQKITPSASNTGNIDIAGFIGPISDYAHTYYPTSGTVWFNDSYNGTLGNGGATNNLVAPVIGQHGFATFIHELGHAFGLNHSGNYNAGNGTPEPTNYQDSTVYSIMSYFGPSFGDGTDSSTKMAYSTEVAWGSWLGYDAQTPMLDDILAIQNVYGVSSTTRTGDTVYGFHSNITGPESALYDFNQNAHPVMCLFDSSGNDTLDLSGDIHNDVIDLHAGAFSSVMGLTNNLSIAYSATIENAVGGGGNDTMYANDVGDRLDGGSGDDTISGGAGADSLYGGIGNDTIRGSAGADLLDGGSGTNTLDYSNSLAGVSVNLASGSCSGGYAQGDSIANFQIVDGSASGNDTLIGSNTVASTLYGLGGNDLLVGGAAGTHIYGGAGDDYMVAWSGADYMDGGAGYNTVDFYNSNAAVVVNLGAGTASGGFAQGDTFLNVNSLVGSNGFGDTLVAAATSSWLYGYGGDDLLIAGGSGDHLNGGDGNDILVAGGGADFIDGGTGVNTVGYYNSPTAVTVDLSTMFAAGGWAQGDTIINIQDIMGSNAGNDRLTGTNGANYIAGFGGADIIEGKGGDDYLEGGAGNDTFVYSSTGFGHDTISDFTLGQDKIQISKSLVADFAHFSLGANFMSQSGVNAVLHVGSDTIQLDNINASQLTASDFIFV